MMLLRFACLICLLTANIKASTHWMVTESGLIQSKEESQFIMARPSDLLSFLNQEIRWHNTFAMYDDLIIRQRIINSLWSDLEEQSCISKHIVENEYCNAAGDLQNFKWNTVSVEDGKSFGISEHEFKLYAIEEFGENDVPDCKKISSLTFSMSAFEHLEAMINRAQLNATAEKDLPAVFTPLRTIDEYGHWLSETLRRNTTSWLHYNLASIYWRLKGNVPKALECSRRAVHYAPRMYKTVPLLCMGSILLRSDMTDDAVVVLGAAVDHSPSYSMGHFTLAEAYATAGEFNSSIKHFNISISLDRNFAQAIKYQNAVLCHVDMLNKMHNTQRTLKKLSAEMREFRNVESQWYQTHSSFLYTMKHEREYHYKNVDKNCLKMEEISNLNIKELRKDRDRNSLIQYLVNNPQYSEQWERKRGITALFDAFDLEKAVKRTAKKTGPPNKNLDAVETKTVTTFLKEIGPKPSLPEIFIEKNIKDNSHIGGEIKAEIKIPINLPDINIAEHLELSNLKKVDPDKLMYPPNMQISRNREDFDIDPEWPPTQFCIVNQLDIPETVDSVHPVFLPFEHKGISVNSLLSDKIGVPALMEHELPWHPPLCPTDKEFNFYSNKKALFKMYKTVPLLCMGSILLRSDMTDDAVVVLGAAVDHSPSYSMGHFTLAEAYATAGEFNSSIKHFNISISLDRNFAQAIKYQNAVLCHVDMLNKMHNTQRTLKKLSAEMREFRNVESQWYQTHSSFLYTMKHEREYHYKNVDKNCLKMEEISNLNIKELRKDRDRNSLIQYLVNNPQYSEQWERKRGITALFDAFDLEKAVKRTAKKTGPPNKNLDAVETKTVTTFLKEIGPKPSLPEIFIEKNIKDNSHIGGEIKAEIKIPINLPDINIAEHLELSNLKKVDPDKLMYPPNMQISRNREDFDIDPEWPPTQFCIVNQLDIPETVDSVHPVFLPFEHKGISVNSLLSDKIGVPALMEHELPWHPPLCPTDKEFNFYSNKKALFKVQLVSDAIAAAHLKSKLLMYVSTEHYETIKNMQDAEIGQRIHTAIQKKLASKWVLFTLASLYWRVRGNTQNALNCLLTAKRTADTRYKDVVLVSLGSVFLDMGLWEDALIAAEEAFRMGPYEPPTNFLLAQLHLVRKQPKAQYFHMKQVLRVEPQYMDGYARSLFNAWACLHKQFNEIGELEGSERLFCSETEPGVNMMCRYDGTDCRVAGRDQACSKETGGGARMFEVKTDTTKERKVKGALPWYVLKPTFDNYIEAMPTERSDIKGHEKNFETMIESFAGRVSTCPENDCAYGAEALNLRIEECTYDLFQVDYWLMHVCFPQELNDVDLHMMTEMATMPPSHRKVPECKVPYKEDEDFFVARILSIDTDNWSPLLNVMQHFNGLYSQFDFANMGARLASYVEANPRSWVGATMSSWWCGAEGRAACTARCAAAAHALAPRDLAHTTLRHLVAALHMQSKAADAMEIAYLAFYTAPRGSVDALILGLTHYYRGNVNEALWMYRYALAYDSHYVPAMTCLHIAMCERAFGANLRKSHQTST